MAELEQPNIVGNYLSNYYAAQQKQQADQDRQRAMQRQDRQDYMAEQQFAGQQDLTKLETALKRGQAMTQIIGRVRDGDAQGFEAAKAQAVQELGLPPEQVAHLTIADLPRLRAESGQTMRELEIAYKRAQIASEQAQASQGYAAADVARANAEFIRNGKMAAGGKQLTSPLQKELASLGDQASQVNNSIAGFKDEYGSRGVLGMGGEMMNQRDRLFGGSESANWWQSYDRYKNVVRNELFGASLTPGEQASFEAADITPNMDPKSIRANLATQLQIVRGALARRAGAARAQGFNGEAIDYLIGDAGSAPMTSAQPAPQTFVRGQGVFTDQPVQQAPAANGGWSIKRIQ